MKKVILSLILWLFLTSCWSANLQDDATNDWIESQSLEQSEIDLIENLIAE